MFLINLETSELIIVILASLLLNRMTLGYFKLGDTIKAYELLKQAYLIDLKTLGQEHPKTQILKEHLSSVTPKFISPNETREYIKFREAVTKATLDVNQKIQTEILNKVHKLAEEWSNKILGIDWGAKGYSEEGYLRKQLGTLVSDEAIIEAKMLIFEAINLGIMRSDKKDLTCVKEFVHTYPNVIKQIVQEHPEYFIDGSIVRACIKEPAILTRLLGEDYAEHITGQGSSDYIDSSYWNEYLYKNQSFLAQINFRIIVTDQK